MLLLPALIASTGEEEEKFSRLYDAYFSQLYHYAFSRLGNRQDAQDALQESFRRVLAHLDCVEKIQCSKTRGFLFIIVKRECIRIHHRNRRERELCGPLEEAEWRTDAGADPTWHSVEPRLAVAGILQRLRALPEADQELFLLKYHYGLSYRELAGMFSMSEKNVSVRLSRIKQRLLEELRREGEEIEAQG